MSGPNWRAGGAEGRPKPRDGWRTPPGLYAVLDAEFHFALDVACESHNQLAGEGLCADLGRDGLRDAWSPGPVWCNPPYGCIRPWVEKAIEESLATTVVMLLPVDTSTRWWWQTVAQHAAEIRFIVGRLRFLAEDGRLHRTKRSGGGLTQPSAVVVFRPEGGPPFHAYMQRP